MRLSPILDPLSLDALPMRTIDECCKLISSGFAPFVP
ncbi:unnamed protein product [Musa acuminata var. zebrina]